MDWGVTDVQGWRKGPWTPEEDKLLSDYISLHGDGRWSSVAKFSGLNRNGKSCRLRWVNYLRPGLKKGHLTPQEEGIIIELHAIWGNKWSTIARYLPGRTDNEIKNYWRAHFKVKSKPSQRQEKRKSEALGQQKHHLVEESNDKNKCTGTDDDDDHNNNGEVNKEKITELQGGNHQDMVFTYHANSMEYDQPSPGINFQDVAVPWQETIVEDDYLWGSLWNLDGPH